MYGEKMGNTGNGGNRKNNIHLLMKFVREEIIKS